MLGKLALATAAGTAVFSLSSQAALIAGDIAIIGATNNGSPDVFTIVALDTLDAGEIVYFTDNGWTGSAFRGATDTDGDGNENLVKFTVNSSIAAGTIISSNSTGTEFSWTTSGSIPGATSGSFANLAQGQGGEQIYAFQNSSTNDPLFAVGTMTHLFQYDDTGTLENAADSSTGNAAPGLSVAADTIVLLSSPTAGTRRFDISTLASGSKEEWLDAIANPANWGAGTLPSGTIVVPEPATLGLLGLASLVGLRRRSR